MMLSFGVALRFASCYFDVEAVLEFKLEFMT